TPPALICYSQATAALGRFIEARGLRAWDPINVICAAEPIYEADRAVLERAFGPVYESYGSREVMLIAHECEAHSGMHLSDENLLVELVVEEAGSTRPARPG